MAVEDTTDAFSDAFDDIIAGLNGSNGDGGTGDKTEDKDQGDKGSGDTGEPTTPADGVGDGDTSDGDTGEDGGTVAAAPDSGGDRAKGKDVPDDKDTGGGKTGVQKVSREHVDPAAIAAATAQAFAKAQREEQEAAEKKRADAEARAKAEAAEAAKYKLSEQEEAELNKLEEEWGDMSRMIELRLKRDAGLRNSDQGKMLQAMVDHIYKDITPIATSQQELNQRIHFTTILDAHADFDDVQPKLEPWIKTQPAYLQKALLEVYTNGTAEEVIDLVQRFKDASGIVTPEADDSQSTAKATGSSVEKPKPTKSEPDPKKVQALTPVGSQRSKVQTTSGTDKNDFDGGWAEALEMARVK